MSKKNAEQENKELKIMIENLNAAIFKVSSMHGNALDMMYLQMITMIEILSEAKIITPEKWEEKLNSVSKDMEKRIQEKMDVKSEAEGKNNEKDPDRTNANSGSGKIIIPNSKIIIP